MSRLYLVCSPLTVIHGQGERRVNAPRRLHFVLPFICERGDRKDAENLTDIYEEILSICTATNHKKECPWHDGHCCAIRHNDASRRPENSPSPLWCWSSETFSSCRGFPLLPPLSSFASPLTFGFLKAGLTQITCGLGFKVSFCAEWTC